MSVNERRREQQLVKNKLGGKVRTAASYSGLDNMILSLVVYVCLYLCICVRGWFQQVAKESSEKVATAAPSSCYVAIYISYVLSFSISFFISEKNICVQQGVVTDSPWCPLTTI